jgi:hypothetical protein
MCAQLFQWVLPVHTSSVCMLYSLAMVKSYGRSHLTLKAATSSPGSGQLQGLGVLARWKQWLGMWVTTSKRRLTEEPVLLYGRCTHACTHLLCQLTAAGRLTRLLFRLEYRLAMGGSIVSN